MWPLSLVGAIASLLLGTSPSPQRLQLSAERALLDSLLTELSRVPGINALPKSRCAGQPSETIRLCDGLVAERRSELTGARDDALAAEVILERAVAERPKFPVGWYGLGLARLELFRDKQVATGGPLMPVGKSYRAGAANAMVRALELDSMFERAAKALLSIPVERKDRLESERRLGSLRGMWPSLAPLELTNVAELEYAAGNLDSAIAIRRRVIAGGRIDRGPISLSLAANLFEVGREADGAAALVAGAADSSAAGRAAYRAELALVAAPGELVAWDSVPATARPTWLAAFWGKRDVTEGRRAGARLAEHYRRYRYALANYAVTLPTTGRQTFITVSGTVDLADEDAAKKWTMEHPFCAPELAHFLGDSRTVGTESPFRYYHPIQDLVDDRGVIYIRHGPPTDIARTTRGEALEVWKYSRPSGDLVLEFREADFDGTAGASVLVPTLLTLSPVMTNQVCVLDQTLCSRSQRFQSIRDAKVPPIQLPKRPMCSPGELANSGGAAASAAKWSMEIIYEGTRLSSEAIVRARDSGRKQIDLATTTDSYHRDFAKAIHPAVQVYGLDAASGGAPRLLIAFALPGQELASVKRDSADARQVYPVTVQVMTIDAKSGNRRDIDTLRQFVTAGPLAAGQFITGTLDIPMPPGRYATSIVFTQTDGHGAIAHLDEIAVPGSSSRLTVSDLVLGRENSGVHWNSGTTTVALNPLNTYPKGSSAEVYFQLSGLTVGTSYKVAFELFRADDDPKKGARLTVASMQPANDVRMELTRSLGLTQLDPGRYRVKLTVSGGGAETSAVGWLTIVK